jgi:hypothetical protein
VGKKNKNKNKYRTHLFFCRDKAEPPGISDPLSRIVVVGGCVFDAVYG